jgi:hypothetical protein
MMITFTPLLSLAPARSYAPGIPMCAKWQGSNGSTAWTKSVFHTVTMRPTPGSP